MTATATKPRLIKPAKVSVEAEITPRAIHFEGEDGSFALAATGIVVSGKPEFGVWEKALDTAVYLEARSPFWKADLLEYAHKRTDWQGFIDAVIDAEQFTASTVSQYRYIARNVPKSNRVEGVSFSHHAEVAKLPSEDQRELLERAKAEHLSVSEFKKVVRKSRKVRKVLSGQASDLRKAHNAVAESAYEAASLCRQIPQHDCANAERLMVKARKELETCEAAIKAFRKAQGREK